MIVGLYREYTGGDVGKNTIVTAIFLRNSYALDYKKVA